MPAHPLPSLMDDRAFLAELEQWESASVRPEPAHVRSRPLDDLDFGLPEISSETDVPEAPPWPAPIGMEHSRDSQSRWLVGGFFLMMLTGAAGAALVFHQRVVGILAPLR